MVLILLFSRPWNTIVFCLSKYLSSPLYYILLFSVSLITPPVDNDANIEMIGAEQRAAEAPLTATLFRAENNEQQSIPWTPSISEVHIHSQATITWHVIVLLLSVRI